MSTSQPPSPEDCVLDREWRQREALIRKFRDENEAVWLYADTLIAGTHVLLNEFMASRSDTAAWTDVDTDLFLAWQDVIDYQTSSLFQFITKDLNVAYSTLRMASELVRDIARVHQDASRHSIWKTRVRDKTSRKQYRKQFTFDERNGVEALVLKVYDLCSEYATHGHVMNKIAMAESTPRAVDLHYLALPIDEEAVVNHLSVWFTAFYPMQSLCVKPWLIKGGGEFQKFGAFFFSEEAIGNAGKFAEQLGGRKQVVQ